MCGRFTLKTPVADWLADLFPGWHHELGPARLDELPPDVTRARYNVAPSQQILVVYSDSQGQLQLEPMRWGLVPSWADSLSAGYNMINARSETIADKPSFKSLLHDKRCIVVADGYYEWRKVSAKVKTPYWIHLPNERAFAMAGLWAENRKIGSQDAQNSPLKSVTIITTPANADTQSVHDRMPAFLVDSTAKLHWLDPAWNDKAFAEHLVGLLQPCQEGRLRLRQVSNEVNSPKNEGASLIFPV